MIITLPSPRWGGLIQPPKSVDFADIVNHRIQSPLHIHLPFRAERKAVHVLILHFADSVLQAARDELLLQGDGQHNELIIVAGFEFSHRGFLARIEPRGFKIDSPLFRDSSNVWLEQHCGNQAGRR